MTGVAASETFMETPGMSVARSGLLVHNFIHLNSLLGEKT